MAGPSLKEVRKIVEDKTKLALVLLQKFINERSPREKQLIIVLGILGIIFLDYWLLIHPVVKIFANAVSQGQALETELKGLKDDRKNQVFIERNWNQTRAKLEESEKRFV